MRTTWNPTPYLEHFGSAKEMSNAIGVSIKSMHQWILKGHINESSLAYFNRIMGIDAGTNENVTRAKVNRMVLSRASKQDMCTRFGVTWADLNSRLWAMYGSSALITITRIVRESDYEKVKRNQVPTRLLAALETSDSVREVAEQLGKSPRQVRRDIEKIFCTSNIAEVLTLIEE